MKYLHCFAGVLLENQASLKERCSCVTWDVGTLQVLAPGTVTIFSSTSSSEAILVHLNIGGDFWLSVCKIIYYCYCGHGLTCLGAPGKQFRTRLGHKGPSTRFGKKTDEVKMQYLCDDEPR